MQATEYKEKNQTSEVIDLRVALMDLSIGSPAVADVLSKLERALDGKLRLDAVVDEVISVAAQNPYADIADYMGRTWLRSTHDHNEFTARIHNVKRSDHDRALHDHPWHNASLVLRGGYWEVKRGIFQAAIECQHYGRPLCMANLPGDKDKAQWLIREVDILNRLIRSNSLSGMNSGQVERLNDLGVFWRGEREFVSRLAGDFHRLIVPEGSQAWSLFIMAPKIREWGFYGPNGWEHHEVYLKSIGKEA